MSAVAFATWPDRLFDEVLHDKTKLDRDDQDDNEHFISVNARRPLFGVSIFIFI